MNRSVLNAACSPVLLGCPQVVSGLVSGSPFAYKLQLAAGQPSEFCPGPNLFGWTADGAYCNGVNLLAASATALAATRVASDSGMEFPPILAAWAQGFSIISASHVTFTSASNRVLQMWKETMINAKVNQRLNPIMMAKSLTALSVKDDGKAIENIVKAYDAQVGMNQSLKLSKQAGSRIKCFMNRNKLPLPTWTFLEAAWSRTSYEASAYYDKMFDLPAFYVGSVALETYSDWWRRMLSVTPKSQMAVLKVVQSHFDKHHHRVTELIFRSVCARSAFLHNSLEVLVKGSKIDAGMVESLEKAFIDNLDSPLQNELAALLDIASLPDVAPADAAAWISDTCSWVRRLKVAAFFACVIGWRFQS